MCTTSSRSRILTNTLWRLQDPCTCANSIVNHNFTISGYFTLLIAFHRSFGCLETARARLRHDDVNNRFKLQHPVLEEDVICKSWRHLNVHEYFNVFACICFCIFVASLAVLYRDEFTMVVYQCYHEKLDGHCFPEELYDMQTLIRCPLFLQIHASHVLLLAGPCLCSRASEVVCKATLTSSMMFCFERVLMSAEWCLSNTQVSEL